MIFLFKRRYHPNLKVYQMLQRIYGLGPTKIRTLLIRLGVTFKTKLGHLRRFRIFKLNKKLLILEKFFYFNVVKNRETNVHYNRVKLGTYKGIKLNLGLPLNGQSTRTNAKTFKRLNRKKGLFLRVLSKMEYERRKMLKKSRKTKLQQQQQKFQFNNKNIKKKNISKNKKK